MQQRSILLGRCDRISARDVVAPFRSIIIFLVSTLIVPLERHKIWVGRIWIWIWVPFSNFSRGTNINQPQPFSITILKKILIGFVEPIINISIHSKIIEVFQYLFRHPLCKSI